MSRCAARWPFSQPRFHSPWARRNRVGILASLLVATMAVPAWCAEVDERPFGLARRIPWTTSKLIGSPEPPLPYIVARVFEDVELKAPIYLAEEPVSGKLLVVLAGGEPDRPSRIVQFSNAPDATVADPFFELPRRLIYSICFHPDYAQNRQVFVFTNGPVGEGERTNRVTRYMVTHDVTTRVNPQSEQLILEWRSAGHDGGDMAFGNDRFLYISTGDGTSDSDGWNSGQTVDDLLGSVLRIDVNHAEGEQPYAVPTDNPLVNVRGARPEIWAYGLRNPWRMSLDLPSGQLWVGNNGQDLWETAHLVRPGENYGWSVYEGSHPFYLGRQLGPTPLTSPTIEHHHAEFRSLTGGVVYRGAMLPELEGVYVYGDYSSGRIWGMKHDGQRPEWHRELADTSLQIAAFCLTRGGDLLVVDHTGGLYRLQSAPPSEQLAEFPTRLSDTGLFTSTRDHIPDAGLTPYAVNAPAWADGATAERFVALPGDAQAEFDQNKSWTLPDRTALVQTLSLERRAGDPTSRFRVETRVLLKQQGEWGAYSYRWNDDQSDALLAPKDGADAVIAMHSADGTPSTRTWRVPSRAECLACHSRAANFVLGLSAPQLDRDHDYGDVDDNQLRAWEHIGLFKSPLPNRDDAPARLVDPYNDSQEIELRARSYLHVNCSACHVEAGGGNAKLELEWTRPRERMNLVGARPQHETFGIDNAMLVFPGDPDRSVLLQRLKRRGPGQMPPIALRAVDERAIELFHAWIAQLPPDRPLVKHWAIDDFDDALGQATAGRSIAAGEKHFRETGCIQCHRLGSEGGVVGPSLLGIGKRLKPMELLDSILLPSKVIAAGYAGVTIETEDGRLVTGRIEREDAQQIIVRPASSTEPSVVIPLGEIVARHPLETSNMPSGTVDVLQKDEILDLLAFLLAAHDETKSRSP